MWVLEDSVQGYVLQEGPEDTPLTKAVAGSQECTGDKEPASLKCSVGWGGVLAVLGWLVSNCGVMADGSWTGPVMVPNHQEPGVMVSTTTSKVRGKPRGQNCWQIIIERDAPGGKETGSLGGPCWCPQ